MIDYDSHRWWSRLFLVRGSLLAEIGSRVLITTGWSAAVVAVHHYLLPVSIPMSVHNLAGMALSLLLVFRTNTSYSRFWEGRTLWGGIVNDTRNLARAARPFFENDAPLYRALLQWTVCFPYATAGALQGRVDLGPLAGELPPAEVERVRTAQHLPMAVAQRMSAILAEGRKRGLYSDYVQMKLDQNVHVLIGYLGGCERIHKTPIPFGYIIHLRRALVLYFSTLPFAMVNDLGWGTVGAMATVAYLFFGIEEIGVEIEDPFGNDPNDLPLERICATIHDNLLALAPGEPSKDIQ
jgi:putative membrane protein